MVPEPVVCEGVSDVMKPRQGSQPREWSAPQQGQGCVGRCPGVLRMVLAAEAGSWGCWPHATLLHHGGELGVALK